MLFAGIFSSAGCYTMRASHGGGETEFEGRREVNPRDIALPADYRIEVVATGLSFPADVCFDSQNRPHVVESGYSYGEVFTTPRLVRIESGGRLVEIARGAEGQDNNGPWTGVAFHEGAFYVAEGGVLHGGRILRIDSEGKVTRLLENLPSVGDHHTNGPAIGPDGKIYFAIGTATNSGVVGIDNHNFGWLARNPQFCDIPAKDITLAGKNYGSGNPLTAERGPAVTGAFVPFGTGTRPGQVIEGKLPATGAVMRIALEGGEIELVAWGLRNPFGLTFSPAGQLFVTENSYDVRGSRPVFGTGDLLWRIDLENLGAWHGWPDFHGQRPLTQEDHFQAPGEEAPGLVLAQHPNTPPAPVAILPVHASANHFDFSGSQSFGHVGEAFIACFGDMAPAVGKVIGPVGFDVVRVDPDTGVIHPFAVNRGRSNGPASKLESGGLERPIAARFDRTGEALYIVDFGVLRMEGDKPKPEAGTGVLWRVTRAPPRDAQEQRK
jgi:glucose/arabinose dehydrogenase